MATTKPTPAQTLKEQDLLEAFFLPDLCNTRAIMFLLILSEALVLALTLTESSLLDFSWQRFAIVSLFVQWVALLSVAILCQLRGLLARLSVLPASTVALLITSLVTLIVSLSGEYLWPMDSPGIDWPWVLRNQVVAAIFSAMALRYFYVQSQWRMKTQAELKSRLAALQANIRPHFFFNTLNTVASLIMIDPDKAEHMLVDLAQLFRAVLKADDRLVLLQQEIELGQRYLDIEQVRLGHRMQVQWKLPDELPPLRVPQLLLQPLLENAVYHGVQPVVEGGFIHVELSRDGDVWQLDICNSKAAEHNSEDGNRMAHANIRARLAALLDDRTDSGAELQLKDNGQEYLARLRLPVLLADNNHTEEQP